MQQLQLHRPTCIPPIILAKLLEECRDETLHWMLHERDQWSAHTLRWNGQPLATSGLPKPSNRCSLASSTTRSGPYVAVTMLYNLWPLVSWCSWNTCREVSERRMIANLGEGDCWPSGMHMVQCQRPKGFIKCAFDAERRACSLWYMYEEELNVPDMGAQIV